MIESAEDFRPGMRSEEPYRSKRLFFLRIHPLCRPCAASGFTVAAAEIDHIVPVKQAPDRFLDRSNWQPICRPCLSGRPQDGERGHGGGRRRKDRAGPLDGPRGDIWPLLLDIRAAGPTEEEGPDMSDKASVLEGIQKAIDMVSALCAGKQKWIRSIPPQPERDPDVVIYRALTAARRLGGPRAWFPVGIQSRRPPHRPDRPRPRGIRRGRAAGTGHRARRRLAWSGGGEGLWNHQHARPARGHQDRRIPRLSRDGAMD